MDKPYVYINASMNGVVFLLLYVNKILLIGNNIHLLYSINIWLSNNYFMKDMEEETYILGIKTYKDRSYVAWIVII